MGSDPMEAATKAVQETTGLTTYRILAQSAVLAYLRALHAEGPFDGIIDAGGDAEKFMTQDVWLKRLAALIKEETR